MRLLDLVSKNRSVVFCSAIVAVVAAFGIYESMNHPMKIDGAALFGSSFEEPPNVIILDLRSQARPGEDI